MEQRAASAQGTMELERGSNSQRERERERKVFILPSSRNEPFDYYARGLFGRGKGAGLLNCTPFPLQNKVVLYLTCGLFTVIVLREPREGRAKHTVAPVSLYGATTGSIFAFRPFLGMLWMPLFHSN